MAYEVTATRRRPQAFDALIGQEFVAETLKNALTAQKIAHAYLFAGPRGCGKTSTARILAKALNCERGPTAEPCGGCRFCREITQGACTDVIEIDGASNTSVNDVRVIKDELLFPPQSARYKIYIIDEVHMLSNAAFNALLKTIEEPPPFAVFIFATTELQKVPATIKSRCQQYNFRLVSAEKVKELLAQAAAEIGIEADDEALYWIARESTGSVRDSYTLFDQVAAFSGGHITYEKIRDKLGLVGIDRMNELFDLCVAGNAQGALLSLDGFFQSGISIEQIISNAADYVRSLLLIKSGVTKESLLGQSAERFSKSVVDGWSAVQMERALSLLFALYRDIRYSLSPRYELELAFSRLSWLSEYVSPREVKHAIDQARNLLLSAPSRPPSAPAQAAQSAQAHPNFMRSLPMFDAISKNAAAASAKQGIDSFPDPTPVDAPPSASEEAQSFSRGGEASADSFSAEQGDFREGVLRKIAARDSVMASCLMQTFNWQKSGSAIYAETPSQFHKMQIEKTLPQVEEMISSVCGEKVTFALSLKVVVAANPEAGAPSEVLLLCNAFKGRIVGRTAKSEEEKHLAQSAAPAATEKAEGDASDAQESEEGDGDE